MLVCGDESMRIKHRMPAGHLEESADYVVVKTRSATPEGSFWLQHPLDGCSSETGFINSQPSMAEFMTALPHVPGGGGGGEVVVPSMSPQHTPPGPGYPMDVVPHGMDSPGVNVPEYPWMKEKKTTRKSSQQGKLQLCFLHQIRDVDTSE